MQCQALHSLEHFHPLCSPLNTACFGPSSACSPQLSPTHGSSYWLGGLSFGFFFFFTTFYFKRTGLQSTTSMQKQNQTSTTVQRKCQTHSLAHSTPCHSILQQQSWRQQLLKQTGSLTPGATEIPRSSVGDESKDDTLTWI